MVRKMIKSTISVLLALIIASSVCINAFAASSKQTYIKDMIISYGKSADEAKSWLTDNGYTVLDYDLNEGADASLSTKRAVYLGFTSTDDASEAVRDIRLMNMNGGYSFNDYEMILDEYKDSIRVFINNFIASLNEFRNNYKNGSQRAVSAYEFLNLLYDDDTDAYMGDLLLKKIKEEYTDAEWNALSADEKAKTADITTILMQGNGDAVLAIEQIIAMATDDTDTLWVERYSQAKTYDDMLDDVMKSGRMTVNDAEKQLAAEYDDDAKIIASKIEDYKTYLSNYTYADISFSSTEEEIDAYLDSYKDVETAFDYVNWYSAGTQYELLKVLMNDDISLLDLLTGDDFDIQNEDRCMLYPLVASLTDGQRACLEFLPLYKIVALGMNDDDVTKEVMSGFDMDSLREQKNSLYDGVDRTIFQGGIALTNEALKLQASSGKLALDTQDGNKISAGTWILWGASGFCALCSGAAFGFSSYVAKKLPAVLKNRADSLWADSQKAYAKYYDTLSRDSYNDYESICKDFDRTNKSYAATGTWSKYLYYAGIALVCVSVILLGISLWRTIADLKEYYNAEFTPIPKMILNEAVNSDDEKVYTFYSAVKCNRIEAGMSDDRTSLLEDYGDLNGDVGRQWLALYISRDPNAGDPVTTDLRVRYENSNLPSSEYTALSLFCENSARNLTDKRAGFTYADDKNGIYMFFNTDKSVFSGSVFSNGLYITAGVIFAVVIGVAAFFAGYNVRKKKELKNSAVNG